MGLSHWSRLFSLTRRGEGRGGGGVYVTTRTLVVVVVVVGSREGIGASPTRFVICHSGGGGRCTLTKTRPGPSRPGPVPTLVHT